MYIENKYWNHYIGDTDDSLTLVEYLAGKQKEEITLGEIFSDTGLDQFGDNFRSQEEPLTVVLENVGSAEGELYAEFYYAIDLITDLAALMLECKINGSVNLCELFGEDLETDAPDVRIVATSEEHKLVNRVLADFASSPLEYDLSEMCPEEDMLEMAQICGELRKELYGEL